MKKNTVIRSDNPHTVKMQAGSNVAQRKPAAKDKLQDALIAPTIDNIQHLPPESPKASTTAANPQPSKPKRQKVQLNTAPETTTEHLQPGRNQTPSPQKVKAAAKATPPTTAAPGAKTKKQTAKASTKNTSPERTTPKPQAAPAPAPAPAASVWEEDNPIRHRLALLRTRNAELEEQIQRLNQTMPARGNRP
jgi:hypothetical protein